MLTVRCVLHMSLLLLLPFTVVCSRYDYLLFENFELMKQSFLKEQELVKNLKILRSDLYQQMDALNSNINNASSLETYADLSMKRLQKSEHRIDFHLKNISRCIQHEIIVLMDTRYLNYRDLKQDYSDMYNYTKSYQLGSGDIIDAALKGVIMLQETYDQEIKEYSAGHLRFKSSIERNSRKIDSLQPDDLASMSTIAFNDFNWYDSGLYYLKAAIDMFYSLSNEKRKELPEGLEKSMLMMKKQYPLYHNDMFYKKPNIIGPDWKMYPHIVNKGV